MDDLRTRESTSPEPMTRRAIKWTIRRRRGLSREELRRGLYGTYYENVTEPVK